MIENIFSEFKIPTEKEWQLLLTESQKENIKLFSLSEIYAEPAIAHKKNHLLNISNLKPKNAWLLCESIETSNINEINANILTSLEAGTNCIRLKFDTCWELADFETIFNGVFLEYVFLVFEPKNDVIDSNIFLQNFNGFLKKNNSNSKKINGLYYKNNTNIFIDNFNRFPNLIFTNYYLSISDNSILELTDLLIFKEISLFNYLSQNINKNIAFTSVFDIKLSNSFYVNIAKIRALKILWKTICFEYKIEPKIIIKSQINTNYENANLAVIMATNQSLSAVIGGIDILEIEPFLYEEKGFSKRIARNIQHILALESNLDQVIDPANGSYFIDDLTKKLTEAVWLKFQQKVKNN